MNLETCSALFHVSVYLGISDKVTKQKDHLGPSAVISQEHVTATPLLRAVDLLEQSRDEKQ